MRHRTLLIDGQLTIKCGACREQWKFSQHPRFGTTMPLESEHCPCCGAFLAVYVPKNVKERP